MRVALIPMNVKPNDFEYNWRIFKNRFIEAIKENADFLVYPEYCLTGFTEWDFSKAKLYNLIVSQVSRLANRYGVYVVFGLLEPCNESAYNTAFSRR